jgi:hypothetical protein
MQGFRELQLFIGSGWRVLNHPSGKNPIFLMKILKTLSKKTKSKTRETSATRKTSKTKKKDLTTRWEISDTRKTREIGWTRETSATRETSEKRDTSETSETSHTSGTNPQNFYTDASVILHLYIFLLLLSFVLKFLSDILMLLFITASNKLFFFLVLLGFKYGIWQV